MRSISAGGVSMVPDEMRLEKPIVLRKEGKSKRFRAHRFSNEGPYICCGRGGIVTHTHTNCDASFLLFPLDASGTRPPVQLSSASRTLPGTQHLAERISLIASQNNLTVSKPVATLASAAIEV